MTIDEINGCPDIPALIQERYGRMSRTQRRIGDYILTGGELAAMVLTDCVARFIPGVLGSAESPEEESFSDGLLEYPQYTRPRELDGMEVPEVLLSGDHAKIRAWRRRESILATRRFRPDLLEKASLSDREKQWLEEM